MNRFFDLLLCSIALFLLFPLCLIIILILKMTGEGEVFYRQVRVGRNCQPFHILKFATMLKNSPNLGSGTITSKNDPRILPVGRILRRTKLNEIPQLFNVMKGDMSLIGPRPLAPPDLEGVTKQDIFKIYSIKPGLSGIGSLFFRNEEKILQAFENPRPIYDGLIAPYKAKLELWYVENKSIKIYWSLILLTFVMLFVDKPNLLFKLLQNLPEPPVVIKKLVMDVKA